jgi:hypothetical protein
MKNADVAAYAGRWRPSSVSPQAAEFARQVVPAVSPGGQERAKNTPCVNLKPRSG